MIGGYHDERIELTYYVETLEITMMQPYKSEYVQTFEIKVLTSALQIPPYPLRQQPSAFWYPLPPDVVYGRPLP